MGENYGVHTTVIPRYGKATMVLSKLEELAISLPSKISEKVEQITAFPVVIARKNIDKLRHIRDEVDLILVKYLTSTELDNEYDSLSSEDLRVSEKCVVYSPTAKRHKGEMSGSGKSSASYYWQIDRGPSRDSSPVRLLLQSISPFGKTSHHYHKKTVELFLPLVGKTILYWHDRGNKVLPRKVHRLMHSVVTRVMPRTGHQLQTLDEPALNVLGMCPGNLGLEDHIYISDEGLKVLQSKSDNFLLNYIKDKRSFSETK